MIELAYAPEGSEVLHVGDTFPTSDSEDPSREGHTLCQLCGRDFFVAVEVEQKRITGVVPNLNKAGHIVPVPITEENRRKELATLHRRLKGYGHAYTASEVISMSYEMTDLFADWEEWYLRMRTDLPAEELETLHSSASHVLKELGDSTGYSMGAITPSRSSFLSLFRGRLIPREFAAFLDSKS